jgi:hypothetical protein
MILKRNDKILPLIFTLPEYENSKYIDLVFPTYCSTVYKESAYNFVTDNNHGYVHRTRYNEYYKTFYLGIIDKKEESIISMLVKYNNENYLLLCKDFAEKNTSATRKIKKSAVETYNIDVKKKLILAEESELYEYYLKLISPTFEDYKQENKVKLAKEFIEWKKNND